MGGGSFFMGFVWAALYKYQSVGNECFTINRLIKTNNKATLIP